jgi:ABC-type transport system involved in multi-copper enzyme maturation permease subunit
MMPFMAILRHELRSLWSSWLVRLWLIGTALLALFMLGVGWETPLLTSRLIATLLSPYLIFPWAVVVMILGISPITGSRLEALADGILSRPITRFGYLLASWAARVVMVLAVFLVVMVPIVCLAVFAEREADDGVTLYGVIGSLGLVGLVLTFFVSLGFMTGTVLRRPLLAAVLLVFVWLMGSLILLQFSLEEFSTISLDQALPTLLVTPWGDPDVDEEDADKKLDAKPDVDQLTEEVRKWIAGPKEPPGFYERGDYGDFSLNRVALAYGLSALAAIGLAILCFYWRDL